MSTEDDKMDAAKSASAAQFLRLEKESKQTKKPVLLENNRVGRLWGVLHSLDPTQGSFELEDGALGKNRRGPKRKSGCLIGRHPECDIVIDNRHVSNRHCLIFKESCWHHELKCMQDLVFIEDFSSNGTFVNGIRVKRGTQHLLYHGDEIQFAKSFKSVTERFENKFYFLRVNEKSDNSHIEKNKLNSISENNNVTSKSIYDKYIIGETLGSGNFGTVRIGTCRKTKENFAVKVISKENIGLQPKFVDNLRHEITLLMTLSHPNIIEIHDVYDELGYVYLILEYMGGGELFDSIIREKFYPEKKARAVMKQIFEALKYLHDRNISHRDLKPENILLHSKDPNDYRIKISDFGLAKFVDSKSFMGTLCGTPNYVAPEILTSDQDRKYTKSVDMWSAGVVMYICLCGFPPFSEDLAPPPLVSQIQNGMIRFPSPHWNNISTEAIDLITKLIIVDPTKRLTASSSLKHQWFTNFSDESPNNAEITADCINKITDDAPDGHNKNTNDVGDSLDKNNPNDIDSINNDNDVDSLNKNLYHSREIEQIPLQPFHKYASSPKRKLRNNFQKLVKVSSNPIMPRKTNSNVHEIIDYNPPHAFSLPCDYVHRNSSLNSPKMSNPQTPPPSSFFNPNSNKKSLVKNIFSSSRDIKIPPQASLTRRRSLTVKCTVNNHSPKTPVVMPSWFKSASRNSPRKRVQIPSLNLPPDHLIQIRKTLLKDALKKYGY